MIGTTHFTNAVVQRRDLGRVAAVRIGLPSGASLPPFVDWPEDLADLVRGEVVMLEGGHEFDGRPLVPFDTRGMRAAARRIRDAGIRSVAIAAVFSPLNASGEEEAAAILREECPGRRGHPLPPARPHRPARARERGPAQRLPHRAGPEDDARLHPGPARERHRGAALPHPERRHRHAGGGGGGLSRLLLRVGADQLDARRRVPLQARRGAGGRRGRHHHRHRQPAARLPPRGQQRGRDRRGPHALPDARSPVAGPGRRDDVRRPEDRARAHHRAGQRRLSAHRAGAGVRRRRPHRDRRRGRRRAHRPRRPGARGVAAGRAGEGGPRAHPRHDRGGRGPHEDRRGRGAADRGGRRARSWCRRAWPASPRSSTCRTRRWPTRWAPRSPR